MTTRFARTNGPATSTAAALTYEPVRPTMKTAVANLLIDNAGTWLDAEEFNKVGGRAGDRRLRELRADGWKIEMRRKPGASNIYQHRISKTPAKKVQALFRKPVKPVKAVAAA